MTYFINDGTSQLGPYTLEELKQKRILSSTPVWREGLGEWLPASNLEELKEIIIQAPPSFKTAPPKISQTENSDLRNEQRQAKPKGRLWGAVIVFFAVMLGLIIWNNARHQYIAPIYPAAFSSPPVDPEHSSPAVYLEASGTYHPTFWGDKEVLNVAITNKATHTNYKDVRIRVAFYSQTKSIITTQEYVFYDYVPYGATKNFEIKINKPGATASCGWAAVGATYY